MTCRSSTTCSPTSASADASGLAGVPDARIADVIVKEGYGTQRISSHIMINGPRQGHMPLSSSFALLGQRYVVDSTSSRTWSSTGCRAAPSSA